MRVFMVVTVLAVVFAGLLSCTDRAGGPSVGPTAADFEVGDCVDLADQVTMVDCGDDAAVYEVAAVLAHTYEPCPTGDYRELEVRGLFSLCLMLNALPGDCFSDLDGSHPTLTDCVLADVEVTNVQPEANAACPALSTPLVYSEPVPGRTVCLS